MIPMLWDLMGCPRAPDTLPGVVAYKHIGAYYRKADEEVGHEPPKYKCISCEINDRSAKGYGKQRNYCDECNSRCVSCKSNKRATTKSGTLLSYCRECSSANTRANIARKRAGQPRKKGRPLRSTTCPGCGVGDRGAKRLCPPCLKEANIRWRLDYKIRKEQEADEKEA